MTGTGVVQIYRGGPLWLDGDETFTPFGLGGVGPGIRLPDVSGK